MSKDNKLLFSEDLFVLYQESNRIRKMKQDTVFHSRRCKFKQNMTFKKNIFEQDAHCHYFSCNKSRIVINTDPVYYIRNNSYSNELKKLRIGAYIPDIILDLHGLTQYQAKKKLGELIYICYKEKLFCANVVHGHGKNVLKQQIPLWLSKHPNIIAFHQAPKMFGSDAAILILIDFAIS
ncbi:MAG: endonuclease SmrB [Buchnera aphidicola (Meitanaphis microgallis)]